MSDRYDISTKLAPALRDAPRLTPLEDAAGFLGRLKARGIARREAGGLLAARALDEARVQGNVATIALATTEARVTAVLALHAARTISPLTEDAMTQSAATTARLEIGGRRGEPHQCSVANRRVPIIRRYGCGQRNFAC